MIHRDLFHGQIHGTDAHEHGHKNRKSYGIVLYKAHMAVGMADAYVTGNCGARHGIASLMHDFK